MKKGLLFIFCMLLYMVVDAQEGLITDPEAFHFQSRSKAVHLAEENVADAWMVSKYEFPALKDVTCYSLEIWDESMRLPHWHPNASELGIVISGTIQIILWRSPGETSVFNVSEGMCWFIPQGSLHSLNNISDKKAVLLIGFSSDAPQNIDLPVAFNGIPAPVRNAYTSPHEDLKNWKGPQKNPIFGKYTPDPSTINTITGSPYKFDLAQVTPLFSNSQMGSVVWGVKDNWSILEGISILRAHLKPGVARDAIWYPDAATLYVVTQGSGQFYLIMSGIDPKPIDVKLNDYFFVPTGTLHTFINNTSEDFEVTAFFTKADPLPEVSLSVATSFFPDFIRREAMTEYGTHFEKGDPLKYLRYTNTFPYLLPISSKK